MESLNTVQSPVVLGLSVSSVINASLCADEELSTLKGIEGETSEDKPPQQVNIPMHLMRM